MRAIPKLAWLLFSLLLLLVVANAWMSDDSYITLRSIYHFTEGYGLRWNIGERVQVFTHPLWMMVQVPIYALTKHAYLTAVGLNILLTAATLVLLLRCSQSPPQTYLALVLLMSSRAFVDYATSGLENALAYFLCLLLFYHTQKRASANLFWIVLLSSLLLLTRLDFLLLLAPAAAWKIYQAGILKRSTLQALLLGGLPLLLWELFSLVYYGSLVPNTFYAKAQTGLPLNDILAQGGYYFLDSWQSDWPTLSVILVGVIWSLFGQRANARAWAVGLCLYLFYVLWVGGDFMSGRFFSVPFFLAVLLLQQSKNDHPYLPYAAVLVLVVSFFQAYHPIHIRPSYFQDRQEHVRDIYPHGIVDEKGFAWERSGFLDLRPWDHVFHIEKLLQQAVAEQATDTIQEWEVRVAIGMQGYEAGPAVHIVDQLALSDPLLARLPAERRPNWRVGHYFRKIPAGYLETLRTGTDQFADRKLAAYYQHIRRICTGPLWKRERWRSIYLLNTGQLDYLIDKTFYQQFNEGPTGNE